MFFCCGFFMDKSKTKSDHERSQPETPCSFSEMFIVPMIVPDDEAQNVVLFLILMMFKFPLEGIESVLSAFRQDPVNPHQVFSELIESEADPRLRIITLAYLKRQFPGFSYANVDGKTFYATVTEQLKEQHLFEDMKTATSALNLELQELYDPKKRRREAEEPSLAAEAAAAVDDEIPLVYHFNVGCINCNENEGSPYYCTKECQEAQRYMRTL
jgi:hypothetical protein